MIERDWYTLGAWALDATGHCTQCGARQDGVFDGPPGDWGAGARGCKGRDGLRPGRGARRDGAVRTGTQGAAAMRRSACSKTSTGCPPWMRYCPATITAGTAWMPSSCTSRSAARTSAANSSDCSSAWTRS